MGKGINVPLVADVSKFLAATDDVEGALDEVGGSLDDLAREAQDAERLASDSLRDVATTGEQTADDLTRSFADMARKADDSFDKVHQSADESLDGLKTTGKGKAAEAGAEVGTEFAANLGESIGSGQANIADLLSGTLGGLVAVPGLGAAAAGIGIGALLAKGIIGGVAARKAEIAKGVQKAVDAIDVDLTTFLTKFDKAGFLNTAIADLTKSDNLADDIARFKDLAAKTVGDDTLTHILVGEGTQEDRDQLESLIADTGAKLQKATGPARQGIKDQYDAAVDVLALLDKQALSVEKGTEAVKTQVDAQKLLAGYIRTNIGLLDEASAKALGNNANKLPSSILED